MKTIQAYRHPVRRAMPRPITRSRRSAGEPFENQMGVPAAGLILLGLGMLLGLLLFS